MEVVSTHTLLAAAARDVFSAHHYTLDTTANGRFVITVPAMREFKLSQVAEVAAFCSAKARVVWFDYDVGVGTLEIRLTSIGSSVATAADVVAGAVPVNHRPMSVDADATGIPQLSPELRVVRLFYRTDGVVAESVGIPHEADVASGTYRVSVLGGRSKMDMALIASVLNCDTERITDIIAGADRWTHVLFDKGNRENAEKNLLLTSVYRSIIDAVKLY